MPFTTARMESSLGDFKEEVLASRRTRDRVGADIRDDTGILNYHAIDREDGK